MKDREDFLAKVCIMLFLCLIGFVVVLFCCNGCSSSASVEIIREVLNG